MNKRSTLLSAVLIIVAGFQYVSAQKNLRKIFSGVNTNKGDLNCVYRHKYSAKHRSSLYPFSNSEVIKIVSFRYSRNQCPISDTTVKEDSLIETKTLTKLQIDSLTDILYNNFYKDPPNFGVSAQCYFPRNAILFYNEQGKMIENIIICFHCENHIESSEKINFGSNCSQKMEKLRKIFVSVGVFFGTNRKVNIYPGEINDDDIPSPPEE